MQPEGEDLDTESYGKAEVKTQNVVKRKAKKKKKKEDSDFVFMDRQSIIDSQFAEMIQQQGTPHSEERRGSDEGIRVMELCSSPKKHKPVAHPLHQVRRRGVEREEGEG